MLLKELDLYQLRTRRQFIGEIFRVVERAKYEAKWEELSRTLDAEIKRYQQHFAPYAEVAISLYDLQTDARVSIDGDKPFQPGCVINQFVLYELVKDFQEGLYPYEPLSTDIGLAVGESKAAVAQNLLKHYVGNGNLGAGVERVNQLIRTLGLKTTFMDHPPAFDTVFSLQQEPNLMTTDEAVDVMVKLYRNQIFKDRYWTAFAIKRLTEGKPGLNAYIGLYPRELPRLHNQGLIPPPPHVGVAHKVGYFNDPADAWREVDCDSGLILIDGPEGEIAYAMAIFSKGNNAVPEDSFVKNGWFTWRVSGAVYNFFEEQYL